MADKENMDDELMQQLSSGNMDRNTLRFYSKFIADLQKDVQIKRIYWKGIPFPDVLVAQALIDIREIGILGKIFGNKGLTLGGLDIFPLGRPAVEMLEVNFNAPRVNINFNQNVGGE